MMHNHDKKKYQQVIRLRRDNNDYLLPKGFSGILVRRFFPVMSLVYLISIICIVASSGHFVYYLFYDNMAYLKGAIVVLSCAPPAVVWILLAANPLFSYMANLWFRILAGLLQLTICLSYFMFPEMGLYGMRTYLISSFPAFFLIYYFFVVDPLPLEIVYPLNALGVCALIWALSVEIVM